MEDSTKSEWNIDDEVLKAIFALKLQFLSFMRIWDIENAYWTLILIDSEATPSLSEDMQKKINYNLKEIEIMRKEYIKNPSDLNKSKMWEILNRLYKKMNSDMIEEGYYFRKKELYDGL